MPRYTCCEIMECNDICDNYCSTDCCHNYKKSCDEKICLQVCINDKETASIYVSKNKLDHLIKQIKCKTDVNKYKIICAINLGKTTYIFVQLGYNSKYNTLGVIQGSFDDINKQILNNTLTLHTQYNIYVSAKGENISTKDAMKLKITSIVYNKFNDVFVALLCLENKTLIATIDNLPSLKSLGLALLFVHIKYSCDVLMLKQCVHCIIPCEKNKYKLIIYDTRTNHKKSFILCFE
jgi:hypothetical protein